MTTLCLYNLTTAHVGRVVEANGLRGTLLGVIPFGDRVQLRLDVGGVNLWTSALPSDAQVQVHPKEA